MNDYVIETIISIKNIEEKIKDIDTQIQKSKNNIELLLEKKLELKSKLNKCVSNINSMITLEKNKKSIDIRLHDEMDERVISLFTEKNSIMCEEIRTEESLKENIYIYNDLIEKRRPLEFRLKLLRGTQKYFLNICNAQQTMKKNKTIHF